MNKIKKIWILIFGGCNHEWSKWVTLRVRYKNLFTNEFGDWQDSDEQVRSCQKCGKSQKRYID